MAPPPDNPRPPRIPLVARPTGIVQPADPLSDADHRALRQAAVARRPLRKAAATARASAITILGVGALGVPLLAIWPSWLNLLIVLGIGTVGVVELIGAGRLRRGEPRAAVFLARNQLAFMTLIVAYCVVRMLTFSPAQITAALISSDLQSALSDLPEVQDDITRQVASLAPLLTYGFYGAVTALSVAFQGGLSLYYFTRRRHLETLARGTPEWIQRVLRDVES